MERLPIEDWQAALAGMEAGLADAFAALDAHESRLGQAPAAPPMAAESLTAAERLAGFASTWEARLAAAAETAAEAERLLTDQEAAAMRWAEAFGRWRQLVQQQQAGA